MTRYAVDGRRSELVAAWSTAHGEVAITVAKLPEHAAPADRAALAATLSSLSTSLWWCYAHLATHADSVDATSEGCQPQRVRYSSITVITALQDPESSCGGKSIASRHPVEEAAHGVGRALRVIADAKLTKAVVADVEAEMRATRQAATGDLSGRGRQAVLLTREAASPAQVEAASRLLAKDPLGGDDLFIEFDSTAASVAAAHWLWAAAHVAAARSGIPASQVVLASDSIEQLPHVAPTRLLRMMESGASSYDAVTSLVGEAMRAMEGAVLHADKPLSEVHGGETRAASMDTSLAGLRPERPAADLLDDLLSAIRGCWLLFQEHVDQTRRDQDADEQPAEGRVKEEVAEMFRREVRMQAYPRHRRQR